MLYVADLCDLLPDEQEKVLAAFAADEKQLRFEWNEPTLVRFIVHVLSDDLFHIH